MHSLTLQAVFLLPNVERFAQLDGAPPWAVRLASKLSSWHPPTTIRTWEAHEQWLFACGLWKTRIK
jgi:hypothetical protein